MFEILWNKNLVKKIFPETFENNFSSILNFFSIFHDFWDKKKFFEKPGKNFFCPKSIFAMFDFYLSTWLHSNIEGLCVVMHVLVTLVFEQICFWRIWRKLPDHEECFQMTIKTLHTFSMSLCTKKTSKKSLYGCTLKLKKFLHEVVVLKNYVRTPREELLGRKIQFLVFWDTKSDFRGIWCQWKILLMVC